MASRAPELNWSFRTVVVALAVSVAGLCAALALKRIDTWPEWHYSEVVFGGLLGATAVHRMHPGRPLAVLLVFVPVLSAVLLLGRVLFAIYVMGEVLEF